MTGPAWMSWSSGKDSTYALHRARQAGIEVTGLLTTVNADAQRVAMHGVRRRLLAAQADRLGLELLVVELPSPCPNEVYEQHMAAALDTAVDAGVTQMVFGDLFLADVRRYREEALATTPVAPVFPIWGEPTAEAAQTMIDLGIRAIVTCVDLSVLPIDVLGRPFDHDLIAELPEGTDPCGENGELHTFVWDGPGFSSPIPVAPGEIVVRDGFGFCDLVTA